MAARVQPADILKPCLLSQRAPVPAFSAVRRSSPQPKQGLPTCIGFRRAKVRSRNQLLPEARHGQTGRDMMGIAALRPTPVCTSSL